MPRGKIGMKLIENPKKRRATYKTRRDGLINKTSQLATLCGVDAVLVCFDPNNAKNGQDGGGVTTFPADREEALKVINKYRETPADKIRHILTASTYYQEELAKQQRKLVRIEQCGPDMLTLQDCRLADLSPADLGALLATMDEALLKAQQRIVALGGRVVVDDDEGDHVPAAAGAMVTAPMAPQADYNSFDLAFGKPDAGSMVTPQYNFPPRHEMLPQAVPLQQPSIAYHQMPLPSYTFQMPPPSYTFQMPPPPPSYTFQMPPQPTLIAPLDHLLGINSTGKMDFGPFAMNFPNGAATVPGFYDDSMPGIDAVGGGLYVDDYVVAGGQDFATRHASAGYQHEHHMSAGVWPMSKMNNNDPGRMDAAAFHERDDLAGLPGSSSSSNSTGYQGGFQKK